MKVEIGHYPDEHYSLDVIAEFFRDNLLVRLPPGSFGSYVGRSKDNRLFVFYNHIDDSRQVPIVWPLCVGELNEGKTVISRVNHPNDGVSHGRGDSVSVVYDLPELLPGNNPYFKHVQGRMVIPADKSKPVTITENDRTEPLEDLLRKK